MRALRIGLLGCGSIAQLVHLNVLTSLPDVELVALAESNPERREAASCRVPGALAFDDFQTVLDRPDVEAVVIALPNSLHAEAAVAALKQGKHVYLEKPMATSLDQAGKILAAWRQTDLVGMMGLNFRHNPLFKLLAQQVGNGRIGDLVGVRTVRTSSTQSLPAWKQKRKTGGGVLLDHAPHHIDLVHFIFQKRVSEVFARLQSLRSEEDEAFVHLMLDGGLSIDSFFAFGTVHEDRFEVYGRDGKLAVERYRALSIEFTEPGQPASRLGSLGPVHSWGRRAKALIGSPTLVSKMRSPTAESSYRVSLANFAAAVRSGQTYGPSLADGYRCQAVIEALEESARTGRTVRVPDAVYENPAP